MSVNGVRLPTGYYFGMSAATGDLAGWWLSILSNRSGGFLALPRTSLTMKAHKATMKQAKIHLRFTYLV